MIPGCGSGREIASFIEAGWNVTAIDFSPTALGRARDSLAGGSANLILDDFFTYPFANAAFDLIYERTFLTALPPVRWPAVAQRYRDLLKPGGRIVGYCYYGYEAEGPPFFQPPEQPAVFAPMFDLAEDALSEDALPFLGERERWQMWADRRATS